MNKVMVDNWFLEDVVNDLLNGKINSSNSYAELLMAMVLWDEVYYPQNAFNWWTNISSHIQNRLIPIDDTYENGLPGRYIQQPRYPINGVEHYMELSSIHDCDYLPCGYRRASPEYHTLLHHALVQLDMLKYLDKTVEEYYRDTYKALSEFSQFEIKMPVLAKYIFDNTPEDMTPFDFTLHLKNEGPVITYRQYLNDIENALENQKWKELRCLLHCSEDVVAKVLALDKNTFESVIFNILPTPSILLKFRSVNALISGTPSFSMEVNDSYKKFHLTFLKDLTTYAINDMKI